MILARPGLRIGIALTAAAALAAFVFDRLPGEMRDFEVYWTAAGRAAHGEPLYRSADGHYQFKYLPAFAVLSSPLAWIPLPWAKSVWFVASVALVVTLISLSLAILPRKRRRPSWMLALVIVVAMGKFYGHELALGQVNVLFGVLAVVAILMMRATRDVAAASLFVAAVAVKPYAVLFLPWIAIVRGRRAFLTASTGLLALLALPVVFYGVQGAFTLHRAWWLTITASTAPNLTNADNVSIAGMFAKWLGAGEAATLASLIVSAGLAAAAVLVIARRGGIQNAEALDGALLLTLMPLLSPQGWDYVFLVATPAIALFANHDDRVPRGLRVLTWVAVATVGLSLFDLIGRQRYALFMSWSVITVCFLVLITALVTLRVRRAA